MDITNEQWQRIAKYIPKPKAQLGKSGRPQKNTCHQRFQEWTESRVFAKIHTAQAQDLKERGGLDLSEGFIDGTFAPAKKGRWCGQKH